MSRLHLEKEEMSITPVICSRLVLTLIPSLLHNHHHAFSVRLNVVIPDLDGRPHDYKAKKMVIGMRTSHATAVEHASDSVYPGFRTSIPLVLTLSPVALELIEHLSTQRPLGLSLSQLGCFISLVPPRLGFSTALDDAVKCLCVAYTAILLTNHTVDVMHYTKALKSLRKCICDPVSALSSETLCAVICLSWYEVRSLSNWGFFTQSRSF